MLCTVFRKIGLILAFLLVQVCVVAAVEIEPEIFFGPAFTSIDKTVQVGVGFGGGLNIPLLPFAGGKIEARWSLMPVMGSDSVQGLIVSQVHIPLTIALVFLEQPADGHGMGIGGSIGLGMMGTAGRYTASSLDVRPCFTIDLTFGIFERGALKFRYSTVVGEHLSGDGRPVSYQSLMIIGSTSW